MTERAEQRNNEFRGPIPHKSPAGPAMVESNAVGLPSSELVKINGGTPHPRARRSMSVCRKQPTGPNRSASAQHRCTLARLLSAFNARCAGYSLRNSWSAKKASDEGIDASSARCARPRGDKADASPCKIRSWRPSRVSPAPRWIWNQPPSPSSPAIFCLSAGVCPLRRGALTRASEWLNRAGLPQCLDACGLQPSSASAWRSHPPFGITGPSLPYSDNILTSRRLDPGKLRFSERFRSRLRGETIAPENDREAAIWPPSRSSKSNTRGLPFPQVHDSLLRHPPGAGDEPLHS